MLSFTGFKKIDHLMRLATNSTIPEMLNSYNYSASLIHEISLAIHQEVSLQQPAVSITSYSIRR